MTQHSCKMVVDGETGKEYYVKVTHATSKDVEESEFDIVVTDGAQAWTAEGGPSPPPQRLSLQPRPCIQERRGPRNWETADHALQGSPARC